MVATPPTLHLLHALVPGPVGGLESVVSALAAGQAAVGHKVTVLAVVGRPEAAMPWAHGLSEAGVNLEYVVVAGRRYHLEFQALRQRLRAARPDLVHTHGYRADVIAGLAARSLGLPWVASVHGFTGGEGRNRFYEWLQCRSYRSASSVIAVSSSVRGHLLARGVRAEKVVVVPNAWSGAAPTRSRTEARAQLGLPVAARIVGWVGRLSREKGCDVFLEAVAQLIDPALEVAIIGDGRERPTLQDQSRKLHLERRVHWLGLQPNAAALYPAFDLFVLSSRTEGTPIALFEAMAAGVPIVATCVGGVPDVVRASEAILVAPEDPSGLARGIEQLLADPVASAGRVERARFRLQRDYDAGAWGERHLALYRDILARRRGENA